MITGIHAMFYSSQAASPWGAERLRWPTCWSIGHGKQGATSRPFRGSRLQVAFHSQQLRMTGSQKE